MIFTGSFSKNSPEYFFRQVLKQNNIKLTSIKDTTPKENLFFFDNREFKTVSLTSPSNAANRYIGSNKLYKQKKEENPKYTTFDFRVQQYKQIFEKL